MEILAKLGTGKAGDINHLHHERVGQQDVSAVFPLPVLVEV